MNKGIDVDYRNGIDDPLLRRGEGAARIGSAIPFGLTCLFFVLQGIIKAFGGVDLPILSYYLSIAAACFVGQLIVWVSMFYLWRCEGWDSGVLFYLWAGGFFTSLSICYTWVFPAALIPWIAPITASVAKRRMAVRSQAEPRS
ncbi:hypothetical protein POF50_021150 [Streptomyces sp. SL13]|uniref:Uncharacterized protein n=1 Tax=Streptantibioticus silvisoli TaxID=2705255 RepID=A0AA90HA66_9ACTN|nr:hypothetical protein [Streptantibioticus silvisoli]MDI5971810.1 hypothetical protein [Streptantibioticus silvisoli]